MENQSARMGENVKKRGVGFLLLALCAFGGIGIEAIYAFLIEPPIYSAQISGWSAAQSILHWIITCITWGTVAALLVRKSKKKYNADLFAERDKMKAWQWVAAVLFVVFSFIISYLDWKGFKVVKEFQYHGLLKFIFQYIYYVFETALVLLIIVFAQKACEMIFSARITKKTFPFGGIVAALTWGLAHILSQGSVAVGLLSAVLGFMFGTVYLLVNRDIRKAYLFMFFMFVL